MKKVKIIPLFSKKRFAFLKNGAILSVVKRKGILKWKLKIIV
jgi:hypothetical protein